METMFPVKPLGFSSLKGKKVAGLSPGHCRPYGHALGLLIWLLWLILPRSWLFLRLGLRLWLLWRLLTRLLTLLLLRLSLLRLLRGLLALRLLLSGVIGPLHLLLLLLLRTLALLLLLHLLLLTFLIWLHVSAGWPIRLVAPRLLVRLHALWRFRMVHRALGLGATRFGPRVRRTISTILRPRRARWRTVLLVVRPVWIR